MRITKLEHSGCVVEENGKKIICDPVQFETTLPEFTNVIAIVLTHKHPDHFQSEQISAIVDLNPEVRIFAPVDIEVDEIAGRPVEKVEDGVVQDLGGLKLRFFGRDHAAIVPGKVPCRNIGVVVNEKLVNPGDSFDLPAMDGRVEILLVPSAAPWCKVNEGMEYIRAVKPQMVIPVHNAVLSELGNGFNNNWLRTACEEVGAQFAPLSIGESV